MSNLGLKITNEQKHIAQTEAISQRYTPEEKAKMASAAKDFESLLTSMMIKSMNKTTGGLFGSEGYGGDTFDTLFETHLAKHMSQGSGFGIANEIYRKVIGEDLDPTIFNKGINALQSDMKIKLEKVEKDLPFLTPSQGSINRVNMYDGYINEASKKYGVEPSLIKSVILTESAGNVKAVSSAKAKGLMQLMDGTAQDMGVKNSFDPEQNIMGGTKYLSELLRKYDGDVKLSLAAYNAGPANVEKYDGIPPFDETKTYVTRVLGYLNYLNG